MKLRCCKVAERVVKNSGEPKLRCCEKGIKKSGEPKSQSCDVAERVVKNS